VAPDRQSRVMTCSYLSPLSTILGGFASKVKIERKIDGIRV
jgi:hypothetical protein